VAIDYLWSGLIKMTYFIVYCIGALMCFGYITGRNTYLSTLGRYDERIEEIDTSILASIGWPLYLSAISSAFIGKKIAKKHKLIETQKQEERKALESNSQEVEKYLAGAR
jgi:hypothetical protein